MRALVALLAFVGVAALNLLWWWWPNRPVEIAGWTTAPLQSVSFAPYRPGQSPLTRTFPTPDQIEEDLRRLKGKVQAVRTYSTGENLETVPQRAGKYGLTQLQNLATLPPVGAVLFVGPLPIVRGSGSPCRARSSLRFRSAASSSAREGPMRKAASPSNSRLAGTGSTGGSASPFLSGFGSGVASGCCGATVAGLSGPAVFFF